MRKNLSPKCLAKTLKQANGKRTQAETSQCTRFALQNSRFCANHQNLHELSDEEFETQTKICTGCRKHVHFDSISYNICLNCRTRGDGNRQKASEDITVCNYEGCSYSVKDQSGYCGKHQTEYRRSEIIKKGNKCCTNIIRGCATPELAPDYPYSKCHSCLEKNRIGEINNHLQKLKDTLSIVDSVPKLFVYNDDDDNDDNDDNEQEYENLFTIGLSSKNVFDTVYLLDEQPFKICSYPKHHLLHEISHFLTIEGQNTYNEWVQTHDVTGVELSDIVSYMFSRRMVRKFCNEFTEKFKLARDKRILNKASQPENVTLELKKKWHLENIEKYRSYMHQLTEQSTIEFKLSDDDIKDTVDTEDTDDTEDTEDTEDTVIPQTKIKLILRKTQPETVIQPKIKQPVSTQYKYYYYKRNAFIKKNQFNLTYEQAERLFQSRCIYCGLDSNQYSTNGIDRLFSHIGYEYDNCVSCCKTCNYMKKTMYPHIFVKVCENILIHQKIINHTPHDIYYNQNSNCYESYKTNANNNKRVFELTRDKFNELCSQDCYLCGKAANKPLHINGIDRFNNKLGYTIENSRSCCGLCNFIKRNYEFNQIIEHLKMISSNNVLNDVCPDVICEKYSHKPSTDTRYINLSRIEWELITFSKLCDDDLLKYVPPTEYLTVYNRWVREMKKRNFQLF